ncbi:neuropeptides capa receptor-like isoform X2 [Athalia rosae]|uniref:neuropeptides capa receptor-like isoform X2 n=1 Tax=Athalia rosae TaxID=37344 RepID=UPI002034A270|nr:neuropeptides capa receptor-like isoform X2 [Athalia rosae]
MLDSDVTDLSVYPELLNLTESELLETVLGPKHLPLKVILPLTLAYVTIFVTGVFGNVVTCLVIAKNPAMRTATNYYLFSLAISDLSLLLLGLPNELSVFWQQYPWALGVGLCKIRSYVSELSSYVSVLTIVAFSMERYLAICHPLHLYAMSGLKRPIRFIVAAWSVAIVCAIPFAVYPTVHYVDYPIGAVVVMFFICWAPFHAQRLLYVYGQDSDYYPDINEWFFTVGGCLYYFSTTVNPILYNVMSAKYRGAFKKLLLCSPQGGIGPTRDASSFRETSLCQCDSRDNGIQPLQIRSPKYRSVRCTIDHAKEILSTPGRVYGNKDAINSGSPRSRLLKVDQNGVRTPLLDNRSSITPNETGRRPLEPCDSTASSNL